MLMTSQLNYCRGDIVKQLDPSGSNGSIPFQVDEAMSIVLSSTGPQLLIYFYTDAAAEADGFEIDYW